MERDKKITVNKLKCKTFVKEDIKRFNSFLRAGNNYFRCLFHNYRLIFRSSLSKIRLWSWSARREDGTVAVISHNIIFSLPSWWSSDQVQLYSNYIFETLIVHCCNIWSKVASAEEKKRSTPLNYFYHYHYLNLQLLGCSVSSLCTHWFQSV